MKKNALILALFILIFSIGCGSNSFLRGGSSYGKSNYAHKEAAIECAESQLRQAKELNSDGKVESAIKSLDYGIDCLIIYDHVPIKTEMRMLKILYQEKLVRKQ